MRRRACECVFVTGSCLPTWLPPSLPLHTHTHIHSHTLTYSHTHTHTLFLSLSLSLSLSTHTHTDMKELESQLQEAKEARIKLIVSDGVFSMDGSIAPLR